MDIIVSQGREGKKKIMTEEEARGNVGILSHEWKIVNFHKALHHLGTKSSTNHSCISMKLGGPRAKDGSYILISQCIHLMGA